MSKPTVSNLYKRASQRLNGDPNTEFIVAAASPGSCVPLRASHLVRSILRSDSTETSTFAVTVIMCLETRRMKLQTPQRGGR